MDVWGWLWWNRTEGQNKVVGCQPSSHTGSFRILLSWDAQRPCVHLAISKHDLQTAHPLSALALMRPLCQEFPLIKWTPGVGDGQGGLVCCDSWDHKESDTTERLNWTELKVWEELQTSQLPGAFECLTDWILFLSAGLMCDCSDCPRMQLQTPSHLHSVVIS